MMVSLVHLIESLLMVSMGHLTCRHSVTAGELRALVCSPSSVSSSLYATCRCVGSREPGQTTVSVATLCHCLYLKESRSKFEHLQETIFFSCIYRQTKTRAGGNKSFFILNSIEHEIYPGQRPACISLQIGQRLCCWLPR